MNLLAGRATRIGSGCMGIPGPLIAGHVYYQNIQEPADCPCGAGLQTREHIVFECRMHEEYGDIIDEGAPDH